MQSFFYSDFDREIWDTELASFVPERVFDAHAHIWTEKFVLNHTPNSCLRLEVNAETLRQWYTGVFPNRQCNFLMVGSPIEKIDFSGYREWCVQEANRYMGNFSAVLVTPEESPETLASAVEKLHFRALKPYLKYAPLGYDSTISGFMPERLIEVADHYRLIIVLHVAKPLCFADAENLRELEYFTRKYPRVLWQLAHCARSFNGILLEHAIGKLKALEHICYDLSAVCDPYSMYLLFKHEDANRLLYGSDNIAVGAMRGAYAPFGKSWRLCPENPSTTACTMVCYEQLRAMKKAAYMAEMDSDAIRRIFYDNAIRIYSEK